MASWNPCAVGQQTNAGGHRIEQATATGRLQFEPLSDLRTGRIKPQVDWPEPKQVETPTNLSAQTDSPPQSTPLRMAERPAADLDRSFFDQDQPPVVVVWTNSDLHNSLVSKRQLRQWMRSGPRQGEHRQGARINSWPSDSQSQVRSASFASPTIEAPLVFTRSEHQINDFATRLKGVSERFETKKKQLAADESLDDGSKGELNSQLNLAGEWAGRAKADLEKLEIETKAKDGFGGELEKHERLLADEKKLAASIQPPAKLSLLPSNLREAIDVEQTKLKKQRATLQDSTEERNEIRERISVRDQRVTELPSLLRKNAKEEDETEKLIEELNGKAEDDLYRSLQKLLLDAKLLSLEITEESLELEGRRQEDVGRILSLRLEELTLKIKRINAELAVTSRRSDELRDQEIKERLNAANEALKDKLTQSTPKLKELAEYNKDLASQQTSLAQKSDELESELNNVRQLQEELDESHERIKEQIDTLGPTASGIRLVEHRRSLISTGKSQNRLLELAERLQFKQTRKLQLKERLEQLVLGDNFKIEVLAAVEQQVPGPVQRQMAVDVADHLLETQKKYAEDLEGVFEDNIKKLSDLESAHKTLIDKVQEVKAFSDKNALWVRSAKPIAINDLKLCQEGVQSILVSDQWRNMVAQASANFNKHPYHAGLLALVIGSLLVVRRRLRWSHE